MANWIGAYCPVCADTDHIKIQANVWLSLTSEGTTDDIGDHEYGESSYATCDKCGYSGDFSTFQPSPAAEAAQEAGWEPRCSRKGPRLITWHLVDMGERTIAPVYDSPIELCQKEGIEY